MRAGPDFLVIGAARCGTTWLARALGEHPRIRLSDPKEPNFLVAEHVLAATAGPGDARVLGRMVTDEERWRDLFERDESDVRVGEASVSTLYYGSRKIDHIADMVGAAPMIAVLRAPWERARSAWTLKRGTGDETLSFADALDEEDRRVRAGYSFIWHYRRQSRYTEQLAPFVERFGDRLLVAEFEEMIADPDRVVGEMHRQIGVEPRPVPDLGRVNASSDPSHVRVRRLMAQLHARPAVRRAVRAATPRALRRRVLGAFELSEASEPYPEGFVESFADECRSLSELLGDRAPTWCTPGGP